MSIPFLVICYCYAHIFRAVKSRGRGISDRQGQRSTSKIRKEIAKHKKAAVTIAFIISAFVILFTPNFAFSALVFKNRNDTSCAVMKYYRYSYWGILAVFFSCSCNPWVYAWRLRHFRNAVKNILLSIFKRSEWR